MKRAAFSLFLWASLVQCHAHAQALTLAEREARIAQEQARANEALSQIESRYQIAMRECWQKFAVNDCQAQVRRDRRVQREPWLIQQQTLQAQERQLRLEQRERRLEQKESLP